MAPEKAPGAALGGVLPGAGPPSHIPSTPVRKCCPPTARGEGWGMDPALQLLSSVRGFEEKMSSGGMLLSGR